MPRVVHHWCQNETKSQTLRAKIIMPRKRLVSESEQESQLYHSFRLNKSVNTIQKSTIICNVGPSKN